MLEEQELIRFYEENYPRIEKIVDAKKYKWQLKAIPSIDFEDVKMIILNHIYKKIHLYNHKKPLEAWVATITHNQFVNILRNLYSRYTRPCNACAAKVNETECSVYGEQCAKCSLYKKWEKNKKHACDIKLPTSIENHTTEVQSKQDTNFELDLNIKKMHVRIQPELNNIERKVYNHLFVDNKEEKEVAELMGYKSKEKSKIQGYKRIQQIKTTIIKKAKKVLDKYGCE